jgi:glycosyltransferase involved in cell wall biosynthesis
MRILLSAYACEPNRGSEPEVGWQRARHMLAHADEVWVLTRANNKSVIEADHLSHAPGLHFIYYDLPRWALRLKKQAWFLPAYFILWQWGAYRVAAVLHRDKPFDRVYHVTFASMQCGSFMGRLGVPFVIGPIAGGERAPLRLRRGMPFRGQASELLRDVGILLQRYSPLAHLAFAAAERIYVTTADSLRLVPSKWRSKTAVHLAIATDGQAARNESRQAPALPRFVFAGRLLHWKGAHFAIRALAEVRRTVPEATLTLVGSGPDEQWLRDVAEQCGVAEAVEFAGQLPREQLLGSLQSYTALVFPSLHDSGGFVVLEALQRGVPVVCLDLGGPGVMVNESCGIVVPTAGADEARVVDGIASAMISLARMPAAELQRLSAGAIARANELSWPRLTESIVGRGDSE